MASGEQLSLESVDRDIIHAEGLFKDFSETESIAFEQQIQDASTKDLMEAQAQLISEMGESETIDRDKLDQAQKIEDVLGKRHQAVA